MDLRLDGNDRLSRLVFENASSPMVSRSPLNCTEMSGDEENALLPMCLIPCGRVICESLPIYLRSVSPMRIQFSSSISTYSDVSSPSSSNVP